MCYTARVCEGVYDMMCCLLSVVCCVRLLCSGYAGCFLLLGKLLLMVWHSLSKVSSSKSQVAHEVKQIQGRVHMAIQAPQRVKDFALPFTLNLLVSLYYGSFFQRRRSGGTTTPPLGEALACSDSSRFLLLPGRASELDGLAMQKLRSRQANSTCECSPVTPCEDQKGRW